MTAIESGRWDAGSAIRDLARSYLPAAGVVALSSIALLLLDYFRTAGLAMPLWDLPSALVLLALVPYLGLCAVVWRRLLHRESWPSAWATARQGPASAAHLLALGLGILLARAVLVNAVAWKYGIPMLGGFQFDLTFDHWDRLLHDGEAWRLLAPLLRWPIIWIMDRFYALWYLVFIVVVIREAWRQPDGRQRRFFFAFCSVWIMGSLIAVLLPSAGPIYFTRVTHQAGYGDLAGRLATHPLLATTLERDLWSAYQGDSGGLVKGIAAFPSLHVAMPALYAASSWARSRRESMLWWCFAAMTLIGSIVTGWHYAVDGYAAIIGALVIWRISAWI